LPVTQCDEEIKS